MAPTRSLWSRPLCRSPRSWRSLRGLHPCFPSIAARHSSPLYAESNGTPSRADSASLAAAIPLLRSQQLVLAWGRTQLSGRLGVPTADRDSQSTALLADPGLCGTESAAHRSWDDQQIPALPGIV
ncbi:hypothetical protein C8R45DRAFT_1113537 [Mycena sanguinolenta]|nr:hypothetical protein C8R45DRAFT_1113535 [Mycena sanguinolenta]KAJ6451424.1 hypothetical protein C8R45DRAFT_1113537 [Mycena sanguinolenta]